MRCIFFLVSLLFCMHIKSGWAVTSQQQRVPKHFFTQSRYPSIASLTTSPLVVSKPSPNTSRQQVSPSTTIDKKGKNTRNYMIEEKIMQRAWMYSAVLPGWGQVYNKHYWKLPVIYVGLAGFCGGAIYYHRQYIKYRTMLFPIKAKKQGYSSRSLGNAMNECRTGRDLCIIFGALWYIINIFDAYVGASLKTFTLSDDISMEVRPVILSSTTHNLPTVGIRLSLSFQNENTIDRLWQDGASY